MNARDKLIQALAYDSLGGLATEQDITSAEVLLDAYRAEVLNEAADALQADVREWQSEQRWRDGHGDSRGPGVGHAILRLHGLADRAGEKASAPAPSDTPRADRLGHLLSHIQRDAGEWTTSRVQRLYRQEFPGVFRSAVRRDLAELQRAGHLVVHDEDSGRRYFTLNTLTGSTR